MKTIEIPDDSYRATYDELKYFNSDLNKFINSLPKVLTSIDCDLLQFIKVDNDMKILRIGEYKHGNEFQYEDMKYQQWEALNEIANIFEFANRNGYKTKKTKNEEGYLIRLECVIIIGVQPFEKLIIQDLTKGVCFEIEGENVKKYLTMKKFIDPNDYDKTDFKLMKSIYNSYTIIK
jgi:hypothetical protein